MDESIKHHFEDIFTNHYERLTNSRQSMGGLPFTLENIVCFILFGGRELDIEDVYGDVNERYTMETFMADAKEAGIETNEALYKAISDMVAQKFLYLQPDNHFYSYQATRETARMLNRIYPKMKGISMLAYLGQTIQEMESGRIADKTALSRFDQILESHGVPLPKPKIPRIAPTLSKPSSAVLKKGEEKKTAPGSKIIRDYVLSPSGVMAKIEKSVPDNRPDSQAAAEFVAPPFEPEPSPDIYSQQKQDYTTAPAAPPQAAAAPAPEPLPEESEPAVVNDDEIAAKIADFEQKLALVCPICKTGTLKDEKTAAGKPFYSCTSNACNFISWGRPHQIACARCKNSFMVEDEDRSGQVFLKCPRATCQYRQPLTAAAAPVAKKVVRKRLVRRKV